MQKYPLELLTLINFFKKLPGVGSKTAERFAFQLLNWPVEEIHKFSSHLKTFKDRIKECPECHCLTETETCFFCENPRRNKKQLCVIASAKDSFVLEETGTYLGLYHVIGGLLSPINGKHPEHLQIECFKQRILRLGVEEVILALDSTLEGDTTALYIKEQIQDLKLNVFRLAFGLPLGSSLDFVDGGTLARALTARQIF